MPMSFAEFQSSHPIVRSSKQPSARSDRSWRERGDPATFEPSLSGIQEARAIETAAKHRLAQVQREVLQAKADASTRITIQHSNRRC